MKRYKDFQPTGFDAKGLNGEENGISEYLVVIGRNRDSDILAESNFACVLRELGGEDCDKVQVHRFGHWANGWFELVLAHPSLEEKVEEIHNALGDYPIFDESDYSNRQWEEASNYWQRASIRERADYLREGESPFALRANSLSELSDRAGRTYERLMETFN